MRFAKYTVDENKVPQHYTMCFGTYLHLRDERTIGLLMKQQKLFFEIPIESVIKQIL